MVSMDDSSKLSVSEVHLYFAQLSYHGKLSFDNGQFAEYPLKFLRFFSVSVKSPSVPSQKGERRSYVR